MQRVLALSLAFFVSTQAHAEQILEEIVVTATKRSASIQDIPMSIQAVSGDELENSGINDLEDLSAQISNFTIGGGTATTQITMRGMASGNNRGFEQSVAMFVDGVYMPRSRQYMNPFLDVERVEVLKGPQAVLFGLNATAGSVSVVSNTTYPGDDFILDVAAEYEIEYGGTTGTIIMGGSPSDSLGLRLVYQNVNGDEGFYDNGFTGDDEDVIDSDMVRLSAVWEPSDRLTIAGRYTYTDWELAGNSGELFGPNGALLDGDGQLNYRRVADSTDVALLRVDGDFTGQQLESDNFALDAELAVGEHTLKAIYGRSEFDFDFVLDFDATATPLVDGALLTGHEQDSVELRWSSPEDQSFSYIAGVYYQDSETTLDRRVVFARAVAIGEHPIIDAEMWSAFASGTWHLNNAVRLIGGVRYVDEQKDFSSGDGFCFTGVTTVEACVAPPPPNRSRSSDNLMPEVVVQWDVNQDVVVYGKVGTSAKAGGFTTDSTEFDDEEVLGYELGLKSTLLDGNAELNLVLFRNEFDDLQVNSFVEDGQGTLLTVTNNAGSSTSQGLEIDGRWALSEWFMITGGFALLDAEFDSFKAGPCTTGLLPPCDLSGEQMPWAADHSGSVGLDIRFPVGGNAELFFTPRISFSDEYHTNGTLDSVDVQDSWTKLSASVGVEALDGRWSVSLIGKNLTDEEILGTTQAFAGRFIGILGEPRTIALRAQYRMGAN
jgi:outer membrane receptor protein involved in Fe transport